MQHDVVDRASISPTSARIAKTGAQSLPGACRGSLNATPANGMQPVRIAALTAYFIALQRALQTPSRTSLCFKLRGRSNAMLNFHDELLSSTKGSGWREADIDQRYAHIVASPLLHS